MLEKVLVVDDDNTSLEYAKETLRGTDCRVITMNDPLAALEYLGNEEVAVLVSDNHMPLMRGLELIEKANGVSSGTVKILMSAYTDLATTLCAINQCQVFKVVPKPWEPEEMVDAVTSALRRYHTLQLLRRENEDVLRSLAQTIELKDAYTRGHCDRVAALAVQIAGALDLPGDMQREIKYGSWLHDCGKIGVPEGVLNASRQLNRDEYELIKHHPAWGADVARKANLSPAIINIIFCHHERFDGNGYPRGISGEDIPLEARIVSVADVFDALSSDRPYRKGLPLDQAVELVRSMKGKELDPTLVDLFLEKEAYIIKELEENHGNGSFMEHQFESNRLVLEGDFSIAGIDEQFSLLLQHLAESSAALREDGKPIQPYTIDLSGIKELDSSGCQLLATLLRSLRSQGFGELSLELNDELREKIRLYGFNNEILSGECA